MSCVFIHSASAGSAAIAQKDNAMVVDSQDGDFNLLSTDALQGIECPGDIACEFFHYDLPFRATFNPIAPQPFALRAADGADRNADRVSRKNRGVEPNERIVCGVHDLCIGASLCEPEGIHKTSRNTVADGSGPCGTA